MYSPHAWGCFYTASILTHPYKVFPTRVGVFLYAFTCLFCEFRIPHTRGGVSHIGGQSGCDCGYSPHAWGCFPYRRPEWMRLWVFPTRVGVFPISAARVDAIVGIPHTRGGVSHIGGQSGCDCGYSPHAWGCFPYRRPEWMRLWVFPTRVGVFPISAARVDAIVGIPHTRGGVSE